MRRAAHEKPRPCMRTRPDRRRLLLPVVKQLRRPFHVFFEALEPLVVAVVVDVDNAVVIDVSALEPDAIEPARGGCLVRGRSLSSPSRANAAYPHWMSR